MASEKERDKTTMGIEQENGTEETINNTKGKTESGLDENLAGLLCYIFIGAIIFLFIEKENRFIRFHAIQALLVGLTVFIFTFFLTFIPIIGLIINILLVPIFFIFWLFLLYKAYQGEYFKVPVIGDIAEKQVDQMNS